jgi:hypothetical protein
MLSDYCPVTILSSYFQGHILDGVVVHRLKQTVDHNNYVPPSMTQKIRYIINATLKGVSNKAKED